ncbi:VWA domain-containing protein [Phosphitispora sp. TUW77]|uniref:VWA domain-containing protein n=1 Tax=Phosphitispora sp. TUW77 TaxID=3152361 RepID=UPI003AB23DD9
MGINFSQPYYLILLLLLPYFVHLWARSPRAFASWQQKAFLALRLLIVVLLVFALSGLEFTFRHQERSVIYVADTSISMAGVSLETVDWITRSLADLPADAVAGVVSVGKKAMVENPVGRHPDFQGFQSVIDPDYTDLAAGLGLARAMLPENRGKQIVLISDGRENRGDAIEQARLLKQHGIRLDVLPLFPKTGPEALVKAVSIPSHLRKGEYFDIKAVIEAAVPTRGKVRIMVGNRILKEEQVSLSKGDNRLVWSARAESPGLYTYRVELTAERDTYQENNVGIGIVQVAGTPKVLLVEGTEGESRALADALGTAQIQTEITGPRFIPHTLAEMAGYSSIILVNVPAAEVPDQTMASLETYVRDLGRGLVMVGGENSFGLGGYYKTPVEKALPVNMDIRGKGEVPSVGLVLVIDKSGSMGGTNYGIPKIELAKEAAVRAAEILDARDSLGVIAFDSSYKWVVETAQLKDKGKVEDSIGSIRAGGGTNIFPGLQEAYKSLVKAPVKVKHIILLTDGQSGYGGEYEELLEKMKKDNITLSTIAVGGDSDTGLLSYLAESGQGRYYFTDDFESIPKIFTRETIMAARSYLVQEPFTPVRCGGSGLLPPGGLPALFGYVATAPKSTAETILLSHNGDPVLARWQYGLGRTVAWTSDVKGRWAGEWIKWHSFPEFWAKIVSWTLPQEASGDMIVSTGHEYDHAWVSVDMPGERGRVHDIMAKIISPNGSVQEIPLRAVGPGRYREFFDTEKSGAYMVQVVQRIGDGIGRQKTAGLVIPYSPEYLFRNVSDDYFATLAAAGGGRVLDPEKDISKIGSLPLPAVWGKISLWTGLLTVVVLLFPVDIAARRFNWNLRWAVVLWQRFNNRLEEFSRTRTADFDSREAQGNTLAGKQEKQLVSAEKNSEESFTSKLLAAKKRAKK